MSGIVGGVLFSVVLLLNGRLSQYCTTGNSSLMPDACAARTTGLRYVTRGAHVIGQNENMFDIGPTASHQVYLT